MPRVAFIDYFPTHYRRRLYEEIGRRMDSDFYFFADERERFWNRKLPLVTEGEFRRIDLPRYRIAGQPVMPGVARRILAGRYDAVIKSPNGKIMLPLVYGSAKARGIAFVLWTGMWMHPATTFHRASKPLMEGIYRGADAIVVYGEHVRRFVLETRGVDPGKVFVAGQAVEGERFASVPPVRDAGVAEVLYVGQFEERKGLRYLLDAFERLNGAPARLRLVGNGSQEGWLRARAAGRSDVEIVGYRPQEELAAFLSRARCLVLPSITTELDREPWGLVVNEAMHAGIPVVATNAVGAAVGGLVRDGRNGYVVPERDAGALATAVNRLLADAALAARLGDSARDDVGAFNYDRMASAFHAAVAHAIGMRRARR
jgi:glycosyltransferase involved in cell wall biosynthesis